MQDENDAGRVMAETPEGNLVEAARAGDNRAFGQLFDLWFDRVHDLSRRIVRDPGTAGEVAQDAFLAAWTRLDSLEDPDAFGGWLLRIARNKSLNRLEKDRRSVALDQDTMTTLTDLDAPDHDPLAHLDQAGRVALVWDAAAALGERDMSILDLHLRHGLGAGELAEELGTTPNNAHQILFTLRKRLGTNVRALVLWRAGRPACDNLRRTLAGAGVATFDKQAVKVIERHAQVCDGCSREREDRLSPAALFGAAPVMAAPFPLKAKAASALEAAGVPMAGSATASTGTAGTGAGAAPAQGATPIPTPKGVGSTGPDPAEAGMTTDHTTDRRGPTGPNTPRILAVAAVAIVMVAMAVLLSGALTVKGGTTEVATLPPTSGSNGSTSEGSGSSSTSTAIGATTSTEGGFVVDGGTTAPPGMPTTIPEPGDPVDGNPTSPPAVPPVVPPPTTRPGSSTPATTAPSNTTRPTSPSTTTTTSTTTPAIPPPTITSFSAVTFDKQCRGGIAWELAWTTTDADEVLYGVEDGVWMLGPANGNATVCHSSNATVYIPPRFYLMATGPGGRIQAEVVGTSGIR